MRRFRQMTTYFIIFAAGAAIGLIWNMPVPREAAELQVVIDESHRQNKALLGQIRTHEAELATLRQRLPVAPLAMVGPALAPGRDAPTTEIEDKADADKNETPPATEETALDRFHQYLDETAGMRRRERRQYGKSLVEELREMGEPAVRALLRSLEEGASVRERRLAARLLGALQDPIALPTL